MMAGMAALIGGLAAVLGTSVAVGAATVSRLELTRWISQRLRGAAVASTVFAGPGRVLRTASAVGALGMLTVGMSGAALTGMTPTVAALMVAVGIPLTAAVIYGTSRAIGRTWPEAMVRYGTPWASRLSFMRVVLPLSEGGEPPNLADVILAGDLKENEQENHLKLMSGVLAFTERTVRDVMTPRTDIVALHEGASIEQIGRLFTESGYSRLPVYRDSLDNIVGMVYAFDLMKVTPGGELPLRSVIVAPGSNECAALLLELQRERKQMAIILDEYGGTAGIVTVEDLLEELVGEIFEDDEAPLDLPDSGIELIEVDGSTPGHEVAHRFGVDLPNGVETIGGFIARAAGRIPQPGERLLFNGLEFDVLAATPTRVQRIAVRRGPVRPVMLGVQRSGRNV